MTALTVTPSHFVPVRLACAFGLVLAIHGGSTVLQVSEQDAELAAAELAAAAGLLRKNDQQTSPSPRDRLIAFLRAQLSRLASFTGFAADDTHLIEAHPEYDEADHHDALTSLVRSGVISDYRYIDGGPHPTVIAIRT